MRIRIKKLHSNASLPEYAHGPAEDAGLDIRCLENTVLVPGVAQAVATGLALEIPTGYEVQIRPTQRSGFEACHHPSECTGDDRSGLSRGTAGDFAEPGHGPL